LNQIDENEKNRMDGKKISHDGIELTREKKDKET